MDDLRSALHEITPDEANPRTVADRIRAAERPPPDEPETTLYQSVYHLSLTQQRRLQGIHITTNGTTELNIRGGKDVTRRLMPTAINDQIEDLHNSGLIGPLCASYDDYTESSPNPGKRSASWFIWPYRCQLPDCNLSLDTTDKPMYPIGSRFDAERTREADAYALAMGWAVVSMTRTLVCAGHQNRHYDNRVRQPPRLRSTRSHLGPEATN